MEKKTDTEMITAQQAKRNVETNAIKLDEFLKNIENTSKNAITCIRLFDVYMSFEFINELLKLGYKINEEKGMMGEKITIVSWA